MSGDRIYNFYDRSIMIGHFNQTNFYQFYQNDDLDEADFEEEEDEDSPDEDEEIGGYLCAKREVPIELRGPKAQRVLDGLYKIDVLNRDYQPNRLTSYQKGYLAYQISLKLGFTNVWSVFSKFWGVNPNTLKARYNEARKMDSIWVFDEKIKPIVG